jgi:hypothetical protein
VGNPVRTAGRSLVALAAALAVTASLSACTPGAAQPEPKPTTSAEPTASAEPTDAPETPSAEPTLDTNGSALQNQDYFDSVNERLLKEEKAPDGRAFIDNLVEAGFDKQAMEVTPDRTAVDLAADNIQFSVKIGDGCLLGQYGNTGYVSAVADVLSTGRCLVGRTRTIDW